MNIFSKTFLLCFSVAISSAQYAPKAMAIGWLFGSWGGSNEDENIPYTETDGYRELDPNNPEDVAEVACEEVSVYEFLNQAENDEN